MTGRAHTRPRLGERLARRLRRPARDAGLFDGYDPAVYAGDPEVPEPAVKPIGSRPPWRDYADPNVPGPGSLDSLYDAGELTDWEREAASELDGDWYGHGLTMLDCPPSLARPTPAPTPAPAPAPAPTPAPAPAPTPEPEPAPVAVMMQAAPVSYPPLSFTADFRDLPVFREVARLVGHAPAGLVRDGGQLPPLPGFDTLLDAAA